MQLKMTFSVDETTKTLLCRNIVEGAFEAGTILYFSRTTFEGEGTDESRAVTSAEVASGFARMDVRIPFGHRYDNWVDFWTVENGQTTSIRYTYYIMFDGILHGEGLSPDSNNFVYNDESNITINVGDGDDIFYGGGGNDVVEGGAGSDYLSGGSGADTLRYLGTPGSGEGVIVDLAQNYASGGEAEGDTIIGFERVQGTIFNDIIRGDSATNLLKGYGGADLLEGGSGNDVLDGGSGGDQIEGQLGADILFGGSARDTFLYRNLSDSTAAFSGRDTISDWNKDIIHLSAVDADSTIAGDQRFDFIGRTAFTGSAGELRLSVNEAQNLLIVYGDVDGDRIADFGVRVLGITSLTASDFVL